MSELELAAQVITDLEKENSALKHQKIGCLKACTDACNKN